MLLDEIDDPADAGVERRFSRTGEGDEIQLRSRLEDLIQLLQHFGNWNVFLPLRRETGGAARFTVDAVERTGFVRNKVDAERYAEPARSHRSEDMVLNHTIVNSRIKNEMTEK